MIHDVLPEALTADRSGKYKVSIRLWPDGLSFAGCIPAEKESFFYKEIGLVRTGSYVQALKEAFFAHPFFAYPYKWTYVVCANCPYTLVPDNVFVEKQKDQLMAFTFTLPEAKTLHESLDGLDAKILFGIQAEVYEFCTRSLIRPQYTHAITPLLTQWWQQNQGCYATQLYVALHEDTMDAACYKKGVLRFVNSFVFECVTDIVYYILYVWQQMGMEQENDQLLLLAPQAMYLKVKEILQNYVAQMAPLPLLQANGRGGEAAPADITALFGCEL
jgi:hypothetical protein